MKPEEISKKVYPEAKNNGENSTKTPDEIAEQARIDSFLAVRKYKRNNEVCTLGWIAVIMAFLLFSFFPAQVFTLYLARKAEKTGREFEREFGKKSKNVALAYFALTIVVASVIFAFTNETLWGEFNALKSIYPK